MDWPDMPLRLSGSGRDSNSDAKKPGRVGRPFRLAQLEPTLVAGKGLKFNPNEFRISLNSIR
jgi:hypothetical protein